MNGQVGPPSSSLSLDSIQEGQSMPATGRGGQNGRGRRRSARDRRRGDEIEIPWHEIHAVGRGPPITLADRRPPLQDSLDVVGDENDPTILASMTPNQDREVECHGVLAQPRTSLANVDFNIPLSHFARHNLVATTSRIRNMRD